MFVRFAEKARVRTICEKGSAIRSDSSLVRFAALQTIANYGCVVFLADFRFPRNFLSGDKGRDGRMVDGTVGTAVDEERPLKREDKHAADVSTARKGRK